MEKSPSTQNNAMDPFSTSCLCHFWNLIRAGSWKIYTAYLCAHHVLSRAIVDRRQYLLLWHLIFPSLEFRLGIRHCLWRSVPDPLLYTTWAHTMWDKVASRSSTIERISQSVMNGEGMLFAWHQALGVPLTSEIISWTEQQSRRCAVHFQIHDNR